MKTPPPPPDRDISGVAVLDRVRVTQRLFGLRLERLCEGHDGSRFWRRASIGESFELKPRKGEVGEMPSQADEINRLLKAAAEK